MQVCTYTRPALRGSVHAAREFACVHERTRAVRGEVDLKLSHPRTYVVHSGAWPNVVRFA